MSNSTSEVLHFTRIWGDIEMVQLRFRVYYYLKSLSHKSNKSRKIPTCSVTTDGEEHTVTEHNLSYILAYQEHNALSTSSTPSY